MNKEQSAKKESTSVLEKIRRRTGLLVGIVGLALVIFILESLLGSGASIFGGDDLNTLGHVNSKKIDRQEFSLLLENRLNQYRQQNRSEVDESVRSQAIDNLFNQYVVENVIKPDFEKAGITVSEDELYEKVVADPDASVLQNLTDPNTGKINEQFSKPDGTIDLNKWRQAVQNVTGESEMAVRQMEEMVRTALYYQKFRALLNKGLYMTKAEVAHTNERRSYTYDFAVVHKSFASINDSTVKVSDSDIEKYYKEHKYLYKNVEDGRKLEFVVFDVTPSQADMKAIQEDAERTANEFKGKSLTDDSSFIAQESENGNIQIQDFTKKTMIVRDSSIFTAAPGTVFGPYNEGAYYKIYKLEGINNIADSARVRHILVGTQDVQTRQPKRSMEQAKKSADSLLTLIKEKKVSFDTLVKTYSDDLGSKAKGGDYGWFDENEGFVQPFKDAGLKGTKGNISVVETQFGFHIIEVLDVSKSRHQSYRVAQIFKPISPSDETNQAVFAHASQFAGEHNNAESFEKGVTEQKLTPRLAENVREGDYMLPGVDGAKDIVKWAFTAKKGDVSVFSLQGKHVVALMSGIKNKGTLPLEEVKDLVKIKAIQQKKAEMLIAEFKAKGTTNLEALAKALGTAVMNQEGFEGEATMLNGVGSDKIIAGTALGTAPGKTTQPLVGENGVYVLAMKDRIMKREKQEEKQVREELTQQLTGRTDFDGFQAIKESADIEFHKTRLD